MPVSFFFSTLRKLRQPLPIPLIWCFLHSAFAVLRVPDTLVTLRYTFSLLFLLHFTPRLLNKIKQWRLNIFNIQQNLLQSVNFNPVT